MQGEPLVRKNSHLKVVADQEGCPSLPLRCESGVQVAGPGDCLYIVLVLMLHVCIVYDDFLRFVKPIFILT